MGVDGEGDDEGCWSRDIRYLICCRIVILEMSIGDGGGTGPALVGVVEEAATGVAEEVEEEEVEERVGNVGETIGAHARYFRFFRAWLLNTGL